MEPRNPGLRRLFRSEYSATDIAQVRDFLRNAGTLSFPALPNGLFSAASLTQAEEHTGYTAVWVRDNVHVANALLDNGEPDLAARTVLALADHFQRQSRRMSAIIAEPSLAATPGHRPHVKFNGFPAAEIPDWPHDQNDALGYFLWIFSRMARRDLIRISPGHASAIAQFPDYLQAIRYWSDEDSGHWEEARKNEASSVGAVTAGLRELAALLDSDRGTPLRPLVSTDLVRPLLKAGLDRLDEILPAECVQDPPHRRQCDAALLFLAWPLEIVDQEMADRIVQDVRAHLQGEHGIRRYIGDSFWSANYRANLSAEDRTRDFSSDLSGRDRLLVPGMEAQWCLFDPIVSAVYGHRYQTSGDPQWLRLQTEYFNRSLAQITGDLKCPELWHWEAGPDGRPVLETSEATPLLWTQANLCLALNEMEKSCGSHRR
jgi:phosphorylase kinase alpha/beta subunit